MACPCPILPHLNKKTESHNKHNYAIVLDCAVAHNCYCMLAKKRKKLTMLRRASYTRQERMQVGTLYVTRQVAGRRA